MVLGMLLPRAPPLHATGGETAEAAGTKPGFFFFCRA